MIRWRWVPVFEWLPRDAVCHRCRLPAHDIGQGLWHCPSCGACEAPAPALAQASCAGRRWCS
jgi:ribosomal protein L37AE/L43A